MGYQQDNDYIEVADRIQAFYAKYPDGSLTCDASPETFSFGPNHFVAVHAKAFRTADDPNPGDGWAWEPVPGTTPFTRNSELMNAQTAAIGRAIVAVGLLANRKIASAEEVRNRQAENEARGVSVESIPFGDEDKDRISAEDVETLTPVVKDWLDENPGKRDDFKLKLISLGVVEPNKKLADVIAQLPQEAVPELTAWLGKHTDAATSEA